MEKKWLWVGVVILLVIVMAFGYNSITGNVVKEENIGSCPGVIWEWKEHPDREIIQKKIHSGDERGIPLLTTIPSENLEDEEIILEADIETGEAIEIEEGCGTKFEKEKETFEKLCNDLGPKCVATPGCGTTTEHLESKLPEKGCEVVCEPTGYQRIEIQEVDHDTVLGVLTEIFSDIGNSYLRMLRSLDILDESSGLPDWYNGENELIIHEYKCTIRTINTGTFTCSCPGTGRNPVTTVVGPHDEIPREEYWEPKNELLEEAQIEREEENRDTQRIEENTRSWWEKIWN